MNTSYVSKKEYEASGYTNIEDKEIEKYLELASITVNFATLTRIEKRGFENLNEKQRYFIKRATIEEANYLHDEGIFDDYDVSSYSITDISVTEKETEDFAKKLELSKVAYFYLKRTGLVNRII